jgi:hypothetical protein
VEGEDFPVLVNFPGGNFTFYDFTENTVAHETSLP